MVKVNFFILLVIVGLILPFLGFSQKKDKIELVQADVLEGRGKGLRVLRGNVIFRQDGSLLYSDSAYFYAKENALDAFGNVKIVQDDGGTITSRKLFYNGNTKLARFRDNVVLIDNESTVNTQALDYNMATKNAVYNDGATIFDPPNTLTSEKGVYNSEKKEFDFRRNVKIVNAEEDFTLYSDHLLYNTTTKIATFLAKTTIISKGDTIVAESGTYNTSSKVSDMAQSVIRSGEFEISGNKIVYNKQLDKGTVEGNVRMYNEKDNITILGNHAIHRGDLGYTKVFDDAVMISVTDGDSLFLSADTLVSIDKKNTTGEKKLIGNKNSKVFRTDLQAIADSLVYNFADSLISFYTSPILWNVGNQILADTIHIQMAFGHMDKMYLKENSFIISMDTLGNYNQVKGRDMEAWFRNDSITRVDVVGNSQCIYFVLEEDTVMSGMNKVLSSNIQMFFEENKVKTILFLKKPEGNFFPPHLIQEPDTRLKGFQWYSDRRPTRDQVVKQKL
jgi:lipopolysaccharide export system protein LptA